MIRKMVDPLIEKSIHFSEMCYFEPILGIFRTVFVISVTRLQQVRRRVSSTDGRDVGMVRKGRK